MQLYFEAPNAARGVIRAPQELGGFAKVELEPGASETVEVTYADHAFDVFDAELGDWRAVGGTYGVHVGASSRDIRLRGQLEIAADPLEAPGDDRLFPYAAGQLDLIDADAYAALLGRELPDPMWPRDRPLTRDDIIAQGRGRGGFADVLCGLIDFSGRLLMRLGHPLAANNTHFALELPFRSISRLSGGSVSDDMVEGLLVAVNGRFWRGARHMFRAWRTQRKHRKAVDTQGRG